MNKKSQSQIISTILIILVVMAVFIVLAYFVNSYVKKSTTEAEKRIYAISNINLEIKNAYI